MIETTEYLVGLWADVRAAYRLARRGDWRRARNRISYGLGYLRRQAAAGNWRAVRMGTLRPYRCESVGPDPRCGTGWTPRGARRHLARLMGRQP